MLQLSSYQLSSMDSVDNNVLTYDWKTLHLLYSYYFHYEVIDIQYHGQNSRKLIVPCLSVRVMT